MDVLTRDEAKEMAEELGIKFQKNAKTEKIIQLISDVTGKEYAAKEKKDDKTDVGKPGAVEEQKTVRCIIHSNDRENDEGEIVGGWNGEIFQAKIGVEIDFPEKYFPSIEKAVVKQTRSILDSDGNPTGKVETKIYKRYIIERV